MKYKIKTYTEKVDPLVKATKGADMKLKKALTNSKGRIKIRR